MEKAEEEGRGWDNIIEETLVDFEEDLENLWKRDLDKRHQFEASIAYPIFKFFGVDWYIRLDSKFKDNKIWFLIINDFMFTSIFTLKCYDLHISVKGEELISVNSVTSFNLGQHNIHPHTDSGKSPL